MPSTLSPCQYIYRAGSVIESTCPCIVCYMMCVVFCCPLALQFISKVFFRFRFNQSPPPPTHKKKKKKYIYIYINCIGGTICTRQESQCFPYAGFVLYVCYVHMIPICIFFAVYLENIFFYEINS